MAKSREQREARGLQERTGWSYSECLRCVRTMTAEDIDHLVLERGRQTVKETRAD